MTTFANVGTSRPGEAPKTETCEGFRDNNTSSDNFIIADFKAKYNSYPRLVHGEFYSC